MTVNEAAARVGKTHDERHSDGHAAPDVEEIHDSRNVLRAPDANRAKSMTSMTLYYGFT